MTDPIQHLRERMRDEAPISYMVEALELLPALLEVAEAARKVNTEYDHERGKRGSDCPCLPSIECDMQDALAKLEKTK